MSIAPIVGAMAVTVAVLALGAPAAVAQVTLRPSSGFTSARNIAQAGTAEADAHEEIIDFPGGSGPFTFDEAAAPQDAHKTVVGDRADASAGTVFHASAAGGGIAPLKLAVSGHMSTDASIVNEPATITTHPHFGEGGAESFASINFRLATSAPFTISGNATGDEPDNFADLRGGFQPGSPGVTTYARIEPGDPAFGETGTLPPGDYSFRVRMSSRALAQNTLPLSDDDVANGSYTLEVGAPDSDGDALPDEWETNGVDTDGNGAIDLDLPAMGADPRHKDIFVELDFMAPHRFDRAAGDLLAKAFANAPVTNPDGVTGITMHRRRAFPRPGRPRSTTPSRPMRTTAAGAASRAASRAATCS